MSAKSTELKALIDLNAEVLYEDAPCGYIFMDPNGYLIETNRTFLAWTGFTHEELSSKRFPDLLSVGSRIYYETNYSPLLRMQGFLNEITVDILTKNKTTIPVLISSSELRDESGTPLLIRSTVFNITDRRKYEKELLSAKKEAEKAALRMSLLVKMSERLRSSVDYKKHLQELTHLAVEEFCDLCIVEMIKDGNTIQIKNYHFEDNRQENLNHFPRPEKSILIPDFEIKELPLEFREVANAIEPQSAIVCPFGRDGKEEGWISFYLTQLGRRFDTKDLEFAEELSLGICAAIETSELTASKEKAEAELRESHEWFSTTLKSIGDAVITIKPDKTMEYLNPIAQELTGWTHEEAYGKPMDEVFNIINAKTRGPAFNPVDQVLNEGVIVGLENNTALIRRDGSEIIIEDSASPIKDSSGNIRGVVLVFRDSTAKHQEELERANFVKTLKEEKDVREKFVATLTHDLRSPLTAAKLSIQLLNKDINDPEKVRSFSARVLSSINRLDRMIQDLLDANQMRSGTVIKMSKMSFDMSELVIEVITELTLIHGERFIVDAPKSLPGHWNKEGIRRILENLCNNAIKYGSPNTPVSIKLALESHQVSLSVHNMGNPIPEKDLKNLFDPYKRLETAQEQKGWGLGLTLVKGVTEAHQGRIEVKSNANEGTTFTIYLGVDSRE